MFLLIEEMIAKFYMCENVIVEIPSALGAQGIGTESRCGESIKYYLS